VHPSRGFEDGVGIERIALQGNERDARSRRSGLQALLELIAKGILRQQLRNR
jgi:hypothetical protein